MHEVRQNTMSIEGSERNVLLLKARQLHGGIEQHERNRLPYLGTVDRVSGYG